MTLCSVPTHARPREYWITRHVGSSAFPLFFATSSPFVAIFYGAPCDSTCSWSFRLRGTLRERINSELLSLPSLIPPSSIPFTPILPPPPFRTSTLLPQPLPNPHPCQRCSRHDTNLPFPPSTPTPSTLRTSPSTLLKTPLAVASKSYHTKVQERPSTSANQVALSLCVAITFPLFLVGTRLTTPVPHAESQQRRLWIPQAALLLPGFPQQALYRHRRQGMRSSLGVRGSPSGRAGGTEQGLLGHVEGAVGGGRRGFMLESRSVHVRRRRWWRLVNSQPQF